MILGLYGEDKTCKSTLALSFPKPMVYMEFDIGGFRRACRNLPHLPIKEWHDKGLIKLEQYVMPVQGLDLTSAIAKPSKIVVGIKELFYQFVISYLRHLTEKDVATIVVDTGTLLYEITCLGYLQEKQELQMPLRPDGLAKDGKSLRAQLQREEYREPYARMRGIIYQAAVSKKHLVLTHHATDEYGLIRMGDGTMGQGVTGKRVLHGWRQLGDGADVIGKTTVRIETIPNTNPPEKRITSVFKVELAEVKEMEGMEFINPTYDLLNTFIRMVRGE